VPRVTLVAVGSGQSLEVTFSAELGGDSTVVMEVEHPQYYHPKVLTSPSFSSPILLPTTLDRYHLGQSWHSREH
jgi:hypothetical protein